MKTFSQIREAGQERLVFNKKIDRIAVRILKVNEGFDVYVDGDFLDNFPSQDQGHTMAKEVIKELKVT